MPSPANAILIPWGFSKAPRAISIDIPAVLANVPPQLLSLLRSEPAMLPLPAFHAILLAALQVAVPAKILLVPSGVPAALAPVRLRLRQSRQARQQRKRQGREKARNSHLPTLRRRHVPPCSLAWLPIIFPLQTCRFFLSRSRCRLMRFAMPIITVCCRGKGFMSF